MNLSRRIFFKGAPLAVLAAAQMLSGCGREADRGGEIPLPRSDQSKGSPSDLQSGLQNRGLAEKSQDTTMQPKTDQALLGTEGAREESSKLGRSSSMAQSSVDKSKHRAHAKVKSKKAKLKQRRHEMQKSLEQSTKKSEALDQSSISKPAVPPVVKSETSPKTTPSATYVCNTSKHAHPLWLRADLEYHVTGKDCSGDMPNEFVLNKALPSPVEGQRAPASVSGKVDSRCLDAKHSHPYGMRNDVAWDLTGKDCQGDPPADPSK